MTNLPDWYVGNIPPVHSYHVRITNPSRILSNIKLHILSVTQKFPYFLIKIAQICVRVTNIYKHLRTFTNFLEFVTCSYHEISRTKKQKNGSYHEQKWFVIRRNGVRITKKSGSYYEQKFVRSRTFVRDVK